MEFYRFGVWSLGFAEGRTPSLEKLTSGSKHPKSISIIEYNEVPLCLGMAESGYKFFRT